MEIGSWYLKERDFCTHRLPITWRKHHQWARVPSSPSCKKCLRSQPHSSLHWPPPTSPFFSILPWPLEALSLILVVANPRGQMGPLLPVVCICSSVLSGAASSPRATGPTDPSLWNFFLSLVWSQSTYPLHLLLHSDTGAHSCLPDLHITGTGCIGR